MNDPIVHNMRMIMCDVWNKEHPTGKYENNWSEPNPPRKGFYYPEEVDNVVEGEIVVEELPKQLLAPKLLVATQLRLF